VLDRRKLDTLLAAWLALWVLVGVVVWHEVRSLRPLADSVEVAGTSLGDTAAALHGLASVPLVGGTIGRIADDASLTAASAKQSARDGRRSIDSFAILIGVLVPALAVLPVALTYAILRPRLP
jgi:hypothetical protein